MINDAYMPLLLHSRFLRSLSSQDSGEVLKAARIERPAAGQYVFHHGDAVHTFYLVVEGHVWLSQLTLEGQQILVGLMTPPEPFGCLAGLEDTTYPVSAQTVTACLLLAWTNDQISGLTTRYPQLLRNIHSIMFERTQSMIAEKRQLMSQSVEQRLAIALLRLHEKVGQVTPQGILLNIPLKRQDLADMIGTTQYTVSRILNMWQRDKIVTCQRKQVFIIDKTHLESLISH